MSQPTLDQFFAGGGKSFSWKDKPINTTAAGYITAVHPPVQQTDPVDGKPVFKRDGVTPKMVVRIDLATSERDPQDPEDDGARSLYVQGWMTGAVGEAVRKAGRQGPPEIGGYLQVTLIAREQNENKALNPTSKFSAYYVPPQAQATQQFFDQAGANGYAQQQQPPAPPAPPQVPQAPAVPPQPQYAQPPGFQQGPPPSWAGPAVPQAPPAQQPMPPAPPAQQPVPPAPPAPQVPPAPPIPQAPPAPQLPAKPDAISQQAWDQMDDQTKINIAQTMAGGAPNF